MFILVFSPFLAYLCDQVIRRTGVAGKWTILLILLLAIPALVLWLSGYSFTAKGLSYTASTLFLTGIQLALFGIVNVRRSVKIAVSVVVALFLGFMTLGGSFLAEWGNGSRTVLKEVNYENYKALILEPSLYSGNKVLRVKKTALSGVLQKQIYEQDLPDVVINANCDIIFNDGSRRLIYDLCINQLRTDN